MANNDDMSFIKDSLKALSSDMQTVAERTQRMEQQAKGLDRRMTALEAKVEQGFAGVDQKLDALTEIVSGTVAGIEDHEQRIKMLEAHAGVRGSE